MRHFEVMDNECVGCNLCVNVCPVEDCITMEQPAPGAIDERTGRVVDAELRQLDHAPQQPDGASRPRSKPYTGAAGRFRSTDLARQSAPIHGADAPCLYLLEPDQSYLRMPIAQARART